LNKIDNLRKLCKIDVIGDRVMPVKLNSSQVQQNFGRAMDRAMVEDDVIVERYGTPRVAIVEYRRYQQLIEAERALLRNRLLQASAAVSARTAHLSEPEITELIEQAREEAHQERSAT
jgi:hypothetical protein